MPSSRDLVIFDFDKTLISGDSFRVLSRIAARSPLETLEALALAVVCKLGFLDNTAYKTRVLARLWWSKSAAERTARLGALQRRLESLERASVVALLRQHLDEGHDVLVVSASPAFYVAPFVRRWSDRIEVYASSVEEGGPVTENLRGERKAVLARRLIDERAPSRVWVYADHLSDLPLIELSDRVRLLQPSARLLRSLRRQRIDFEVVPV